MLFVFVDKSFDEIYLFKCQLNGVQVLRLTGNVGRPELRTRSKVACFIMQVKATKNAT
jgi:hypothetical protein